MILIIILILTSINTVALKTTKISDQSIFKLDTASKLYSHDISKNTYYVTITNNFEHIIVDAKSPKIIAGLKNEWIYIEAVSVTVGGQPHKIYTKLWIEGQLLDTWTSNDVISPDLSGRHIYPIVLMEDIPGISLTFKFETGHLENDIFVKDDEKVFTSEIGKQGAVLDQMSTIVDTTSYLEMTPTFCPFFQEITAGRTGILHSIDLKPPLCSHNMGGCGCGSECRLDVIVVKWFENWTDIPWDQGGFTILGRKTISWSCNEYPLPCWREVNFSRYNIVLSKGERFVLMFEGNVWSKDCGFDGFKCLGFSTGPSSSYPNNRGRVGLWNTIPKSHRWEVLSSDSNDFNFRVWQKTVGFPVVATSNFEQVGDNIVCLTGKILDDGGESCQVRFRYRSVNSENWVYPSEWHDSHETGDVFSESVSSLPLGTYVVFQAGAKNSAGDIWGDTVQIYRKPSKPMTPCGPSKGKAGEEYGFYSVLYDPDSDLMCYKWDWGNGEITEWKGLVSSNETIFKKYVFEDKGEYQIRIKAKDSTGLESDWSDPLPITVPRTKILQLPILQFLQKALFIFPMLQKIIDLQSF